MGTHPIFESDFDCLTECQNRKMIRKINEKQVRDAWLRPADKRPDGKRDILGNFHNLKDGDEVVSYWPFESNSDESDMYFDGQIMSLASCPGEGTLTAPPTFVIPPELLKIMRENPDKDPLALVQKEIDKLGEKLQNSQSK